MFEAKTSEQIPNGEVPTQQEPESIAKEGICKVMRLVPK